jgi:hypothetical protein
MERLYRDDVEHILAHLHGYHTAQLLMRVSKGWKSSVHSLSHFWSHVYAWSSGKPSLVVGLSGCDVAQVVCSPHFAIARGRDGRVWQWDVRCRPVAERARARWSAETAMSAEPRLLRGTEMRHCLYLPG